MPGAIRDSFVVQRRPTYKVSFFGGRVPLDLRFRGLLEAKPFVLAPKIDPPGAPGRVFDLKCASCGLVRRCNYFLARFFYMCKRSNPKGFALRASPFSRGPLWRSRSPTFSERTYTACLCLRRFFMLFLTPPLLRGSRGRVRIVTFPRKSAVLGRIRGA